MKRVFGCVLASLVLAPAARADELRLKDGTKIVGTIVGFENNSFKVETSYGFALVRRDKVASIQVTESKAEAKAEVKPVAKKESVAENKPAAAPAKTATATLPPAPAAEPAMREEVDRTTYVNHTYGFRMFKPPSWQVIEGARKTLPTAVVAMGTSDETTLLIVGRETLRRSLEAQSAATEKTLREIYENYRPLGEERTIVAGLPASQKKFRGTVGDQDWSGTVISLARGNEVFTILGMTYADSDLIQIQENVIAKTIASLEFLK